MKFYTHIAGGLLFYVFMVWMFNQPFNYVGIMAVCCMSVIPDLLDRIIGEHRGWGHSAILLIPIILSFFISIWFGMALLSGFMTHILFDILTRKGVAFFYPFSNTRYVMPKKEKSRIITGSKQEKALFIVVVLLLIPVSYGVVNGFPDLGAAIGSGDHGNNTTNKTNNSTLSNLTKKATGDLRSSSSYPQSSKTTVYMPSNTTTSTKNNTDTEQDLVDWLNDNPIIDETENNQTNNTNNDTSITDVLFDDLSSNTDNLAAGDQQEQNMTMEDDSSSYIPNDYTGVNPDDDWSSSDDSYNDEDSGDTSFFFLVGSLISVLGGAAIVK